MRKFAVFFDIADFLMKPKIYSLFNEASELPQGGGAAAHVAPKASSVNVGTIQTIRGLMTEKGTLVAENDALKKENEKISAEITSLQDKINGISLENEGLKADMKIIEEALKTEKKENTSVQAAAVAQVAALGIPQAELPSAAAAPTDTIESLTEKLKAATDSVERGKIAAQLKALRSK